MRGITRSRGTSFQTQTKLPHFILCETTVGVGRLLPGRLKHRHTRVSMLQETEQVDGAHLPQNTSHLLMRWSWQSCWRTRSCFRNREASLHRAFHLDLIHRASCACFAARFWTTPCRLAVVTEPAPAVSQSSRRGSSSCKWVICTVGMQCLRTAPAWLCRRY